MMKWFIFFSLFLLVGCTVTGPTAVINENVIALELADTPEERANGLMHRKFLDEDAGMLFVFENVGKVSFWMKDTLIPLDMLFISEDLAVVGIVQAEPCVEDPCQSYSVMEEVKYVLEVNKGYSERHDIQVGDKVHLRGY